MYYIHERNGKIYKKLGEARNASSSKDQLMIIYSNEKGHRFVMNSEEFKEKFNQQITQEEKMEMKRCKICGFDFKSQQEADRCGGICYNCK